MENNLPRLVEAVRQEVWRAVRQDEAADAADLARDEALGEAVAAVAAMLHHLEAEEEEERPWEWLERAWAIGGLLLSVWLGRRPLYRRLRRWWLRQPPADAEQPALEAEVPAAVVPAEGWAARLSAWLRGAQHEEVPAAAAVDADDEV
jgi:hypothetical protein